MKIEQLQRLLYNKCNYTTMSATTNTYCFWRFNDLPSMKYGTTVVIMMPMSAAMPRIAKEPMMIDPKASIQKPEVDEGVLGVVHAGTQRRHVTQARNAGRPTDVA